MFKKLDFTLDSIRFSPKQIWWILFIIFLIALTIFNRNLILSYIPQIEESEKILEAKQLENSDYAHVEQILLEHHENLEKYRSINSPDLSWFQEEVEALVPYWIQIVESTINEKEFNLRWYAPNLRTIDFLLVIFNTFNNNYWWFDGEVSLESSTREETLFKFHIKWYIDNEVLLSKIYSGDIDWDWITDSEIEEVISASWVKQKRSIIKDFCPFTPSFNIVIWKLIESNPNLIDTFPYYRENYDIWFFNFDASTWCLETWDVQITLNHN